MGDPIGGVEVHCKFEETKHSTTPADASFYAYLINFPGNKVLVRNGEFNERGVFGWNASVATASLDALHPKLQ